ncbi:MAG: hypothetical protein NC181_03810 [Clostridium sp.]|nr:hypothetical protein [Clostridium sp.]MCM1444253.1 hypothetical protein [Candidatus Amulumruptor caecigallinarius]
MKEKLKKYDLLIAIGIVFGLFIILSYIIPIGYYGYDESYNLSYAVGDTNPVGIVGLFKTPIYGVAIFVQYVVVFLLIGALYAVMNKTGAYKKFVDNVVKKFNTHKLLFLIISIITFALLASLSGLPVVLFVLVPFFASIIMLLGFDKVTALVSTVGAILIGTMGSTYGNTLIGTQYFGLDSNNLIIAKFLLLIILTFLLIMFVKQKAKKSLESIKIEENPKKKRKNSKDEGKVQNALEIPFYTNAESNDKSSTPLIVIFILFLVIALLCMFNWKYALNIDLFSNISSTIAEFKIGGTAIFSKILGNFTVIGEWGNYEFAAFILFITIIIGWVYGVKPSEFVDTCLEGAKKMLRPAIYVALSCMIFAIMINSETGNISSTISNFIMGLSKSFNVLLLSLSGIISGFFFNDYVYLTNGIYGAVNIYSAAYPIINIILQASFSFAMLILPVSTILVAGLSYLKVSYTEWIRYIWILLLELFVIIILFGLILTMII